MLLNPLNSLFYILAMVVLGLHLSHGISSVFQTLGLNHHKYNRLFRALGPLAGSALASDAFFPFPDGLLVVAEAGATAVIQPGGSIKDADVIAAADEAGLAMAFTGMRHFRH